GASGAPVLLRALWRLGAGLRRVAASRRAECRHAAVLQPGDLRDVRPALAARQDHRADARRHRRGGLHNRTGLRERDRAGPGRSAQGDHYRRRSLRLHRGAGSVPRDRLRLPRCVTAAAAIRAGRLVVLPTDTVYGLCADPEREDAAREVARLKGRAERQPIALLAGDVDRLLERVPELDADVLRALLPGPYTLILPNP